MNVSHSACALSTCSIAFPVLVWWKQQSHAYCALLGSKPRILYITIAITTVNFYLERTYSYISSQQGCTFSPIPWMHLNTQVALSRAVISSNPFPLLDVLRKKWPVSFNPFPLSPGCRGSIISLAHWGVFIHPNPKEHWHNNICSFWYLCSYTIGL